MKFRPCDCIEVDGVSVRMKLWHGRNKAVIGLKVNNRENEFQGKWFTVLSTNYIDTNTRNDVVCNIGV